MTNICISATLTRLSLPVIRTHGTRKAMEKNSLKKSKENKNVFTEKLMDVISRILLPRGKRKFSANVK